MSGEVKLMPCPFCGQIPEMESWHGGAPTKVMISCVGLHPEAGFINCPPSPSVTGETPDEAAAAWNDRVSPRPTVVTDEVVERVARAIWHTQWEEAWPREGGIEHTHALEVARAAIVAMAPE